MRLRVGDGASVTCRTYDLHGVNDLYEGDGLVS